MCTVPHTLSHGCKKGLGMKLGTPIAVHLKEMKEITDRLASIDAPISEEDQVVTLLGNLPPSYATLVTALEGSTC